MTEQKRNRLNCLDIRKWLIKCCSKNALESYKFLPEVLNKRKELESIFNQFDEDKSEALDFEEVLEMFNKYGFNINRNQLKRYFDIVDGNRDNALNMDEFKACMLDEEAKKIMKEVNSVQEEQYNLDQLESNHEDQIKGQEIYKQKVQSVSFSKIINLLTYFLNREKIEERINERPIFVKKQFESLQDMIQVTSMIELHGNNKTKEEKPKDLQQPQLENNNQNQSIQQLKNDLIRIKQEAQQKGKDKAQELLKLRNISYQKDQKFIDQTSNLKFRKIQSKELLTKSLSSFQFIPSKSIPKFTFFNPNLSKNSENQVLQMAKTVGERINANQRIEKLLELGINMVSNERISDKPHTAQNSYPNLFQSIPRTKISYNNQTSLFKRKSSNKIKQNIVQQFGFETSKNQSKTSPILFKLNNPSFMMASRTRSIALQQKSLINQQMPLVRGFPLSLFEKHDQY